MKNIGTYYVIFDIQNSKFGICIRKSPEDVPKLVALLSLIFWFLDMNKLMFKNFNSNNFLLSTAY